MAAAREDCVKISDERLQLQQENFQIRREMDELRKASLLAQKKAKQQVRAKKCNTINATEVTKGVPGQLIMVDW